MNHCPSPSIHLQTRYTFLGGFNCASKLIVLSSIMHFTKASTRHVHCIWCNWIIWRFHSYSKHVQLHWSYVVAFIRSSFVSSFSIQSLDIFLEVTSISYIAAPAHPNPLTSLPILHTILHWIYWAHMKGHIMSVFYSDLWVEFAPKYSEIIFTWDPPLVLLPTQTLTISDTYDVRNTVERSIQDISTTGTTYINTIVQDPC